MPKQAGVEDEVTLVLVLRSEVVGGEGRERSAKVEGARCSLFSFCSLTTVRSKSGYWADLEGRQSRDVQGRRLSCKRRRPCVVDTCTRRQR